MTRLLPLLLLLPLGLCQGRNFSAVAGRGGLGCAELLVWLGTEKHYSNDKRKALFGMAGDLDCSSFGAPVLRLPHVRFDGGSKSFSRSSARCPAHDRTAVVLLCNFSINNNYSHFLHALLRLFCALVDGGLVVWSEGGWTRPRPIVLWLDNNFKLSETKLAWLRAVVGREGVLRRLADLGGGDCLSAESLLYGSGCAALLPPEKWFGYPGCRASSVLPAFRDLVWQEVLGDAAHSTAANASLAVTFNVREASAETGLRAVSNLGAVQALLTNYRVSNVSFERMGMRETVSAMRRVHVFVSVHGAGLTNSFFMGPGAAVVEVIPWPLCHCRSKDFFYGVGGYYHGSSLALGLSYFPICLSAGDIRWHVKPAKLRGGVKCSWRQLHAVEAVTLDPYLLRSVIRAAERQLVAHGVLSLESPIIDLNPKING